MEHTKCPSCDTTFKTGALKSATACTLHAAAPEMLKALKAGGELWSYLPFDSGADIQEVAQRVAKLQRAAIEKARDA